MLSTACGASERDIAARALAAGANPNDATGPLALAAEQNDAELAELLVSYGADASLCSTALHSAVQRKNPRMTALLLNAGADPNLPDPKGLTPLCAALHSGDIDLARLMFRHGGCPDELVEPAIATGDLPLLDSLLQYGISPDQTDTLGNPLLVRAATDNKPEVAKFLLEKGANPKKTGKDGLTALHLAAVTKTRRSSMHCSTAVPIPTSHSSVPRTRTSSPVSKESRSKNGSSRTVASLPSCSPLRAATPVW